MELANPSKKYHRHNHRVFSCIYHVIFCTKYRRKVLVDDIKLELKKIVLEKQEVYKYKIIEIEVMPDHVHLLIDVDPYIGIYSILRQIKGGLARLLRDTFPKLKSRLPCLWTRSSFISSVGSVSLATVQKYIQQQEKV